MLINADTVGVRIDNRRSGADRRKFQCQITGKNRRLKKRRLVPDRRGLSKLEF